MIGYHYTTKEFWEEHIQHEGLKPCPIRQHEYDIFVHSSPGLQKNAIWVWREPLSDRDAWIVAVSLAVMHDSFNLVLLKVGYDYETEACSHLYKEFPSDSLRYTCNFGIHRMKTPSLPIELLAHVVPPERIEIIWEQDMLSIVYGRHTELEEQCGSLLPFPLPSERPTSEELQELSPQSIRALAPA